jgi:hypothetical protein
MKYIKICRISVSYVQIITVKSCFNNRVNEFLPILSTFLDRLECDSAQVISVEYRLIMKSHYRPGQALWVPGGEAPRFHDNRLMKVVRLSAKRTGRLCPQKVFLVLISVRGSVDPRAIVRPEG